MKNQFIFRFIVAVLGILGIIFLETFALIKGIDNPMELCVAISGIVEIVRLMVEHERR